MCSVPTVSLPAEVLPEKGVAPLVAWYAMTEASSRSDLTLRLTTSPLVTILHVTRSSQEPLVSSTYGGQDEWQVPFLFCSHSHFQDLSPPFGPADPTVHNRGAWVSEKWFLKGSAAWSGLVPELPSCPGTSTGKMRMGTAY